MAGGPEQRLLQCLPILGSGPSIRGIGGHARIGVGRLLLVHGSNDNPLESGCE